MNIWNEQINFQKNSKKWSNYWKILMNKKKALNN